MQDVEQVTQALQTIRDQVASAAGVVPRLEEAKFADYQDGLCTFKLRNSVTFQTDLE